MLDIPSYILGKKAGGGEGGTSNYNNLSNKPSINDVTLSGNKTTADLGITIPTKTSDLTNDGTNASYTSMLHYGLTNEENSGLYFGTGNDVRARKSISSSEYNDTYLEVQANKVTSISSSSTDTQYPSAKAVYDNSLEVYSTTEQVVGTWIDGKPLYQKTFIAQSLPDNSSITVPHGLSNVDKIINANGTACKSNSLNCLPLPYYTASQYSTIFYFIDNTNVTITTSSNRQDYSAYITIQYTKTTD